MFQIFYANIYNEINRKDSFCDYFTNDFDRKHGDSRNFRGKFLSRSTDDIDGGNVTIDGRL